MWVNAGAAKIVTGISVSQVEGLFRAKYPGDVDRRRDLQRTGFARLRAAGIRGCVSVVEWRIFATRLCILPFCFR